jgi:DNA-binding CsgD family transcriptional regulator
VRRTIRRGTRRGLDRILSPDKKRRQRRLEPRWVELAAKHLGLRVDEEIARLCQSLETDQAPDPRAILLRAHRKLTERIGPSWWEYVQHTATGPEHALVTLAIEEAIRETLSTPDRRQIRHLPAVLSLDGRIAKAAVLFLDGRLAKNGSKYGVCPATDRSSIDMEAAEKALGNFSEQERNIWDDKVNGKSNRQIAKDHGMTEKEVRHVCERIRRTLAAVLRPSHGDEDAPSVGRSMLREVRTATYSNRPHVSFQSLFPRPAR